MYNGEFWEAGTETQTMGMSDKGYHVNKLVGFCTKMFLCKSLSLEQSIHSNGAVALH